MHIPGDDNYDFWPTSWPERMSYPAGQSAFARRICEVLQGASISLDRVNAGYVLMFRSKNIEQWKTQVPDHVRKSAEDLSLEILTEIIEALEPPFIYVSGFGAFKRMGCSQQGDKSGLLRFGDYQGVPVIASHHLTGGRPPLSQENRVQIARELSRLNTSLMRS
jgi:hypothetical protein